MYIYSKVLLPDGEPINQLSKDASFVIICDCPDKYIKFPKWSCVLNCYSECPGIFFPGEEMNCDKNVDLPFIKFHHYENLISWYFQKTTPT